MNKCTVFIKALAKVKNWPMYLADYLKIAKGRITYNLRDGSIYTLRAGTNDRNIFNEILIHKLYNPPGFEIKKGDVVVDIGAHIGIFSALAAKNAVKVYSFEPAPENFEILMLNITNNKNGNITPIRKAVYSMTGKKHLFLDKENRGGHSFYADYVKERTDAIETETISLEDVFSRYGIFKIDFLKIDCEGSEYEILFHCPEHLLDTIGKISMEYHSIDERCNAPSLKKFLEDKGFRVAVSQSRNMLHAQK